MNVRFLYPAEIELFDAVSFYENQVAGLGENFLSIIEAALADLCGQPGSWPEMEGGVRKRPVRRFPYSILYRVDGEDIVVLAVMHQRRRPHYWVDRL